MSFSSWPRMWQCQVYSQPKLVISLTTVTGNPVKGSNIGKLWSRGELRPGYVQRTTAVGKPEGERRNLGLHGHDDVFQRIHPDGVPPAQLVVVGRPVWPHPSRPG